MGVTTASSVLKFTLKELEELVKDDESQVYLKKDVKYPLKLTPACLQNVNQAITEILTAERLKYIPKYKGLLLAFKHVRRHSNMGTINDDECNILIHVHVDLYIFAPTVGCTMTGVVSKVGEDDIGCLVHKGFNVTLPRPRNDSKAKWIGSTLQLGDHVKFQLDTFNVVGTLPYIRGTLLSRVAGLRTAWSTELADACRLPTSSKLEKKKKSKVKVETDVASSSPKKLSKKKKHAEEQGKSVEDADAVVTKKIKKRKSDPITTPSFEQEKQGSSKKKAKLASNSISMTEAPYKSSLLQRLDLPDDEREAEPRPSTAKAKSEKKKKKSKAAALNIVAPSQVAESSPKPGKSLAEILASDSDNEDAEAGTKPIATSSKKKKLAKKALLEQQPDAGSKEDVSSSEKKKKVKSPRKEHLGADQIGDMSIEALMQKAMENVSGKTPKLKQSRALFAPGAIAKAAVQLPSPKVVGVPVQADNSKSAQKKTKTKPGRHSEVKSATVQKPSLLDMLHEDSSSQKREEQLPKSPKKKKQTKLSGSLEKANEMSTPSKPLSNSASGSAKRKRETSLSGALQEDNSLPNPAELPAGETQEERPKSPKKKKSTKEIQLLETPASSSKKKKEKSSQSSLSNEDDARKELLDKLLKDVSGSLKKQKKTKTGEPLDVKASLKTPSKSVDSLDTGSVKKNRKLKLSTLLQDDKDSLLPAANLPAEHSKSAKKNKKTKSNQPLENGETPSNLTKVTESSSTKKKSKSILLGFLHDEKTDGMPLASDSVHPTVAKTPAKIRKAFVQSPINSVPSKSKTAKTPKPGAKSPLLTLPPLPSVNQASASKESPAKKQRKSELGSSDLLQKLLNMERSAHFDNADESPALPKSSKKKSKQ